MEMTTETLEASMPDVEKPLSFNAYQAQNNQTVEQPASSEDSPTESSEDSPTEVQDPTEEYLALDDVILHRRDLIVYTIYKHRNLSLPAITAYLANLLNCPPMIVLADIEVLRSDTAFQTHKVRVHEKIMVRALQKKHNKTQCAKAISYAMDSSAPFDSNKIVELSLRYKQRPQQIYNEIIDYKRVSTQLALHKQQHKTMPLIRALIKCSKLNLMY